MMRTHGRKCRGCGQNIEDPHGGEFVDLLHEADCLAGKLDAATKRIAELETCRMPDCTNKADPHLRVCEDCDYWSRLED